MAEQQQVAAPPLRPKYIQIDREQGRFCSLMVDDLIAADHPARMIWSMVAKLDLSMFESEVASFERQAGRAAWSPQVLVSVLVYGYTLGTGSAREMERQMEREPGLRWLLGMEKINHHTLSDFRRQDEEKLQGIFQQVLAVLASEDLVDFETLLQDGTKMKAQASKQSMRRRQTLTEHLAAAKQCVAELDRQAAQEEAGKKPTKKEAARKRAAREKLERMEAAMVELAAQEKDATPKQIEKIRVSETEPAAKRMKHPDGGFGPSYNLQLTTEGKNGFVVGWAVSTAPNDQHELIPGLEKATSCTGQRAKIMIADGGYGNRHNIEEMAQRQVELVAPRMEADKRQMGGLAAAGISVEFAGSQFPPTADAQGLRCPMGQTLVHIGERKRHGHPVNRYQAAASDCGVCPQKPQCSPKALARRIDRVIESAAVQAHDRRMADPAIQEKYKLRKQFAEYPFLRIKSNWRLTRFRLRGRLNAAKESLWMVLAFTMDRLQFVRRKQAMALATAA